MNNGPTQWVSWIQYREHSKESTEVIGWVLFENATLAWRHWILSEIPPWCGDAGRTAMAARAVVSRLAKTEIRTIDDVYAFASREANEVRLTFPVPVRSGA